MSQNDQVSVTPVEDVEAAKHLLGNRVVIDFKLRYDRLLLEAAIRGQDVATRERARLQYLALDSLFDELVLFARGLWVPPGMQPPEQPGTQDPQERTH